MYANARKCTPNVCQMYSKCMPNVLPNVHFVFPDFPRIVEIQMYPNVHLCTSQMYSKCTLKCTPDVHFVFPDFPRIVEIQMYLNVHVHTFRFTASRNVPKCVHCYTFQMTFLYISDVYKLAIRNLYPVIVGSTAGRYFHFPFWLQLWIKITSSRSPVDLRPPTESLDRALSKTRSFVGGL